MRIALALLLAAAVAAGESAAVLDSPLLRLDAEAAAAAGRARLEATRVSLPGGEVALADCVRLLSVNGNRVRLASGIDGTRTVAMAAREAGFWEAALAVCDAFALAPAPGLPLGQERNHLPDPDGGPASLVAGDLELVLPPPGPAPWRLASGALLAEVVELGVRERRGGTERQLRLRVRLRLEPRVQPEWLAGCSLALAGLQARGRRLPLNPLAGERGDSETTGVETRLAPDDGPRLRLDGRLSLAVVEPWRALVPLRTGGSATLAAGGRSAALKLEKGEAANAGASLTFTAPRALAGDDPQVRVLLDGRPVRTRGNNGRMQDDEVVRTIRLATVPEGEVQVEVRGAAGLTRGELPLAIELDLDRLPGGRRAPDPAHALLAPSRIAWPGGRCTLAAAAARLAASGNPVLLELGANERSEAELPAGETTFWEGVVAVCRAWNLAPAPAPEGERAGGLGSGALTLARAKAGGGGPARLQACGALLAEVAEVAVVEGRDLAGSNRRAELAVRLRLEPRVDPALIGSTRVSWQSMALATDGSPLPVSSDQPGDEEAEPPRPRRIRRIRGGAVALMADPFGTAAAVPAPGGLAVAVDSLPSGAQRLRLSGQVQLGLVRSAQAEIEVVPGITAAAVLGRTALGLTLVTKDQAEALGYPNSGLAVAGADRLESLTVAAAAPDGSALAGTGDNHWWRNGRQERVFGFAVTAAGAHRVTLSASEPMAVLELPFAVAVETP